MIVRRITAGAAGLALVGTAFAAAPATAKDYNTELALDSGLVSSLSAVGVTPSAVGKAKLKGTTVTFPAKLKDKTVTNKGGLKFAGATGYVSIENISLNTKNGKATALVKAPVAADGIEIANILVFSGGKNKIKKKGTWKNAKVTLATSTDLGDPAPLMAAALGLPTAAVPTGLTLGKANITVKVKKK